MKLNIFFIIGLFLAVLNISCQKDDDNPGGETVPPRDRGEQEIDDQKALEAYLATHFYNYEDFENPPEDFDYTVRFDSIDEAHADKTPLIESELLERKTVTYDSVEYTLYILKIREGLGEQPTFADSTFVNYSGELLNGSIFDNAVTPIWFDLPGHVVIDNNGRLAIAGKRAIKGFAGALTEFKGASDYVVNSDNTVTWTNDYGIGAVFMPSGLGYFATPKTGIPAYSPLVFGFHLYSTNEADHDHDGIPSYMEDINEDKNLLNDDTDEDGFPNHSDPDDDGDFIPTREEIINNDGSLEFPDEDGDGTPDHLDSEF